MQQYCVTILSMDKFDNKLAYASNNYGLVKQKQYIYFPYDCI